jgi:hypothetical protein
MRSRAACHALLWQDIGVANFPVAFPQRPANLPP